MTRFEYTTLTFIILKGTWRAWIARPLLGVVWWILQPQETKRGQERGRRKLYDFYRDDRERRARLYGSPG